MDKKHFPSGRIREITYAAKERHLQITWDNKTVTAYRPVPREIFDRLCKAPNPATYFEDRIAEEYPQVTPVQSRDQANAIKNLRDLFGN